MKQLLLILSILTTCTAAQAQRYRTTSITDVKIGVSPMDDSIVEVHEYRYKKDNSRDIFSKDELVLYDTSLWYSIKGTSGEDTLLSEQKVCIYDHKERIDTVVQMVYGHKGIAKEYINIYKYDDKDRNIAIYTYAEVVTDTNISFTTVTDSGYISSRVPYVNYGTMLVRKDTFAYSFDGEMILRKIECLLENCIAIASSAKGLTDKFIMVDKTTQLKRYDTDGKLIRQVCKKYLGDNGLILDSVAVDYKDGKRLNSWVYLLDFNNGKSKGTSKRTLRSNTVEYYDAANRLARRIFYSYNDKGELMKKEETTNSYDTQGREVYSESHIYSISGKPVHNALNDTGYNTKQTHRRTKTVSYTSFGDISECIVQYYNVGDTTAYAIEKTTYTYEQY